MSLRTLVGLVIGVALLVLVGVGIHLMGDCEGEEVTGGMGCDFSVEPEHAASMDPCSPPIESDNFQWAGVEINMPARIELPDNAYPGLNPYELRVPIYILLQTTALRASRYQFERNGVAIFFVNRASGETFTSHLVEPGIVPEPTPENAETVELSERELESGVVRYYCNINALEFVQLPNAPATYDVHATFEGHSSRVMALTLE